MTEFHIFTAALNQADPAARLAFLDQACGEAPKRRRRIEVLLKAHELADGFLEDAPPAPESTDAITEALAGAAAPASTLTEAPGSRIGPYKLLQQIGEGGMGVVFMAEQEHPVRRKVALKIIKPGMDSHQVIARFEAERQAIALMDHPNIAKVLDGGLTESGRPYFVMEYVKGVPITEYCDATRLSVEERLNLFVQVCSALQHAH
jgi:serine/threonine protein kinase